MRKFISILLIVMVCLSSVGCKKLVKNFGKETSQDLLTTTSREALEDLAKKSAKETGSKYVGKSLGNQIIKKAAREKVEKEMKKEGLKSFLQYGNHKISKEIKSIGVSHYRGQMLKNNGKKSYVNNLRSLRRANKLHINNFYKNLEGKPYSTLYKGIKIKSYKQGQEALDFISKENSELYKSIKKMMDSDGPFNNLYYLKHFECAKGKNGELLIYNSSNDALSSAILVKGNSITTLSGCTEKCGSPNMFLDYLLPNMRYVVEDGNVIYQTDKLGRTVYGRKVYTPKYIKTFQSKGNLDKGRRNLMVKQKDGRGTKVDDAGHIFQKNMGGINDGINLVPMNSKWQRSGGQWRNVEEYEEKIINDAMSKRQTVISERHLIYEGDSKRPSKIRITVVGGGKKKMDRIFDCP